MSQDQTKKKIGVVVMCLTPEKKEEIEATFRAKYGSEYEIKVMSPEEFKASEYPQAVFVDEVPAMNYLNMLPIIDPSTLTEEQREKIKKMYAEDLWYAQHYKPSDKANHTNREISVGRVRLYRKIFGMQFFEE